MGDDVKPSKKSDGQKPVSKPPELPDVPDISNISPVQLPVSQNAKRKVKNDPSTRLMWLIVAVIALAILGAAFIWMSHDSPV